MRKYIYLILALLFLFSCSRDVMQKREYSYRTEKQNVNFTGIRGHVFDAATGDTLSARIEIRDSRDSLLDTYYQHVPGIFTNDHGAFEMELDPGEYKLVIHHGIDYLSQELELEVGKNNGFELEVYLEPWVMLKEKGWVNGNGHCHLYTDEEKNFPMLMNVRQICLAQGVDFICANQGWAGYDDQNWKEAYHSLSDDRFYLHYGSEMPKYRTGHTWWIGQESTRGYFWNTMDENYEEKYYQSDTATQWDFDRLGFPYIPQTEVVQRIKEADNAAAIMPHPTSWWWQDRGAITKYTTNVASYLSFGLLSGKIWDGLVVMGYDHDHYMYQNLWFNILNQGYRMPAIAELDGGFGKNNRFYYGSMRTYFRIDGDFSIDKVVDAVRRGETFVTSGPVIFADIDDIYSIGETIPVDEETHLMNITAMSSGDREDYLSYVIVFRNGQIHKMWDLRKKKKRTFSEQLTLKEDQSSWYVIKAYGKRAWNDPGNLDVMKVANSLLFDSITPYKEGPHDVAITSPFYFRKEGSNDPGVLKSNVKLSLLTQEGKPAGPTDIQVLVNGRPVKSVQVVQGKASFSMPVHAILKIPYNSGQFLYRGLFHDYTPHLKLIEQLASGRWMNGYDPGEAFSAGEVPWEAFNYEETKKVLSNPEWEIILQYNERDSLWKSFENRFHSY